MNLPETGRPGPTGQALSTESPEDRSAFAILAREHHRNLLVYARALCRDESTAADMVQEAFLAAWRGLSHYDTTSDFAAWMRGITRNKWREHCRKHHREVDVDDATLAIWEDRMAVIDQSRIDGRGEILEQLDDCIKRLPDLMGEVIQRAYFRGEDGNSIASALGIDHPALRKRLQRARETLRKCLDHKLTPAV